MIKATEAGFSETYFVQLTGNQVLGENKFVCVRLVFVCTSTRVRQFSDSKPKWFRSQELTRHLWAQSQNENLFSQKKKKANIWLYWNCVDLRLHRGFVISGWALRSWLSLILLLYRSLLHRKCHCRSVTIPAPLPKSRVGKPRELPAGVSGGPRGHKSLLFLRGTEPSLVSLPESSYELV